jgi:hypothetical protein
MSKQPGFNIKFSYPKGWIQMPVTNSKKILERDKDLEKWAAEKTRAILGPDASPDMLEQRAGELTRLTKGSRARKAWYGLAFYPAGAPAFIALLDVKRLTPDRQYPEVTLDLLQEMYAKYSADTVGDLEVSRTKLPIGPAVRVRGKQIVGREPTDQGTLIEEVTHAIRPPGTGDAVVMQMSWTELRLGDKLAEMADAIAGTVRVTPA